MTPSNRIDALTDGLLQYTRKIGRNLGEYGYENYSPNTTCE